MKNCSMNIFENRNANFRLSVNTMFVRTNMGAETDNVFITSDGNNGYFKPSVFLVFTYLTDDRTTTASIFTSYPHLYKIRTAFEEMHRRLLDPTAVQYNDNDILINEKYKSPVVISDIGKNKDWIALNFLVCNLNNNNDATKQLTVSLELSKTGGYASILSIDEFNSIYDTIMHLDLVSIEATVISYALIEKLHTNNNGSSSQTNYYHRPQSANGYSNNSYYTPKESSAHTPTYNRYSAVSEPQKRVPTVSSAPASVSLPPRPVNAAAPVATPSPVNNNVVSHSTLNSAIEQTVVDDDSDIDDIMNSVTEDSDDGK